MARTQTSGKTSQSSFASALLLGCGHLNAFRDWSVKILANGKKHAGNLIVFNQKEF
jgi:hypothetical protein